MRAGRLQLTLASMCPFMRGARPSAISFSLLSRVLSCPSLWRDSHKKILSTGVLELILSKTFFSNLLQTCPHPMGCGASAEVQAPDASEAGKAALGAAPTKAPAAAGPPTPADGAQRTTRAEEDAPAGSAEEAAAPAMADQEGKGGLSPLTRKMLEEAGNVAPPKPMHTSDGSAFSNFSKFSRAMSVNPTPQLSLAAMGLQEPGAEEPERLDAENMRLQAMRNLHMQQRRSPPRSPEHKPSMIMRSHSVPVAAAPMWGIQELQDCREGAKMSLQSLMQSLRVDHPDLAAALGARLLSLRVVAYR